MHYYIILNECTFIIIIIIIIITNIIVIIIIYLFIFLFSQKDVTDVERVVETVIRVCAKC